MKGSNVSTFVSKDVNNINDILLLFELGAKIIEKHGTTREWRDFFDGMVADITNVILKAILKSDSFQKYFTVKWTCKEGVQLPTGHFETNEEFNRVHNAYVGISYPDRKGMVYTKTEKLSIEIINKLLIYQELEIIN